MSSLARSNLFDPATGKSKAVAVTVPADLPNVRPHFKKVDSEIASATLSPSGARAVFEAHGEVLTAPAEKGDIRNLTNTPGVMERDPSWSPDGKWIAYFSDESGEYQLFLKNPDGMGEARKISLGTPASFYYEPIWSPDSKKIAFSDKRLNIWYVDLAKGTPVKIDTDTYDAPQRTLDPVWSPDSRWIAYSKTLTSHMHAIFAYSLEQGKALQLTDGLSDARFPAFDQKGQYLYFTASTDVGPTTGWLDLSSINRPITRSAVSDGPAQRPAFTAGAGKRRRESRRRRHQAGHGQVLQSGRKSQSRSRAAPRKKPKRRTRAPPGQ